MRTLAPSPRRFAFALLALPTLLAVTGCDGDSASPTAPSVRSTPPAAPVAAMPTTEAAVPGTYKRVDPHDSGLLSQFVLEPTGTFRLQYGSDGSGTFEFTGAYARLGYWYRFDLDMWSTAGPLFGDASFTGLCLEVRWNVVASLTDFEDGTYCR